MFTNNYIKYQKALFLSSSVSLTTWGNTSGTFNFDSDQWLFSNLGLAMKYGRCKTVECVQNGSKSPENYTGIYFGTGSTPATKNDYKLESPITTGLTITDGTVATKTFTDGKYEVSNSYIVNNTTDAEISIYEIGAVVESTKCYSGYDYYVYPSLIERTVLSVPIVIAPGESKLVTYKITFNQTLNVE